jgi:hypothetical protein
MTEERYCSCGDELRSDADLATGTCGTCRLLQESDLHLLMIAAIKELGEIAECLIKNNRPGHWKNELADLCKLAIDPMLQLAEMDFETACELGQRRKIEKMEEVA